MAEAGQNTATPDRGFWTATQAITFLAFGEPMTLDALNAEREAFAARWQQSFWGWDKTPIWLPVLEARAAPAPFCVMDWSSLAASRCAPGVALNIRKRIRRETGRLVAFPEVVAMLRAEWAEHQRRDAQVRAAGGRLLAAVTGGEVEMLGTRDKRRETDNAGDPVPTGLLMTFALTIRNDRLEPDGDAPTPDFVKAFDEQLAGRTYHTLRFRPAAVREWAAANSLAEPPPFPEASLEASPSPEVPTVKAEVECRAWLEGEMRAAPNAPRTNVELRREAEGKWGGKLSGRAFHRAKAAAIANTGAVEWGEAGARNRRTASKRQ